MKRYNFECPRIAAGLIQIKESPDGEYFLVSDVVELIEGLRVTYAKESADHFNRGLATTGTLDKGAVMALGELLDRLRGVATSISSPEGD